MLLSELAAALGRLLPHFCPENSRIAFCRWAGNGRDLLLLLGNDPGWSGLQHRPRTANGIRELIVKNHRALRAVGIEARNYHGGPIVLKVPALENC